MSHQNTARIPTSLLLYSGFENLEQEPHQKPLDLEMNQKPISELYKFDTCSAHPRSPRRLHPDSHMHQDTISTAQLESLSKLLLEQICLVYAKYQKWSQNTPFSAPRKVSPREPTIVGPYLEGTYANESHLMDKLVIDCSCPLDSHH